MKLWNLGSDIIKAPNAMYITSLFVGLVVLVFQAGLSEPSLHIQTYKMQGACAYPSILRFSGLTA